MVSVIATYVGNLGTLLSPEKKSYFYLGTYAKNVVCRSILENIEVRIFWYIINSCKPTGKDIFHHKCILCVKVKPPKKAPY